MWAGGADTGEFACYTYGCLGKGGLWGVGGVLRVLGPWTLMMARSYQGANWCFWWQSEGGGEDTACNITIRIPALSFNHVVAAAAAAAVDENALHQSVCPVSVAAVAVSISMQRSNQAAPAAAA